MSCASELSCCELEAALPTSAPATGCGASHTDGPRAGWHPRPVRCLLLQRAELLRCSYQQSPASLTDIPPTACFVYSRTFPAMPPVFMLMFSFGDIHLSRKSLSLPQLHLAAVLVAVPHCRVLPRIPSQDGWRLPSIPHLPACSCSAPRLNSHSSEGVEDRSRVIVFWLPEAALVPSDEATGSSSPPAHLPRSWCPCRDG